VIEVSWQLNSVGFVRKASEEVALTHQQQNENKHSIFKQVVKNLKYHGTSGPIGALQDKRPQV